MIRGGRRSALILVAATLVASPRVTAEDAREPTGTAAVIDLPDGGFLRGRLLPTPAGASRPVTTCVWQSPLFSAPIEFDLKRIERLRFAREEVPEAPATAWRVTLRGGGFATGNLEAIDAEHVILAVPGVAGGALRIRRAAIERIGRDSAAGRAIVPGGLAGWNLKSRAWREQAGRLLCDQAGAEAFRDLAAAGRSCFDLVLSWDERPEIVVSFATDAVRSQPAAGTGQNPAEAERYRLEMTAGDLLAVREGRKAGKFDLVGSIPSGAGGLHLRVFIDQQAGRMAVVLPGRESAGKPVFDETLAPEKPGSRTGFGILLRDGDLRIDGLRITPWTDPEPRTATSGGLGGPEALLESFDKSRDAFTFRGPGGPRQVAAGDVPMIEFSAVEAAGDDPPSAAVMAAFHNGTRLSGRVVEITADAIRLDCPALVDPLVCEFRQLAEIEALVRERPGPLPGRLGRLAADTGLMLGCLANTGPDGGIAWQSRGALGAVSLSADAAVRIFYRGVDAAPAGETAGPTAAPGRATVHLKTGDTITCVVVSADPAGIRIRGDLGDETAVPAVALRAVELSPGAGVDIPREKLSRLLTLPRTQQADPPTHMLRLPSGDYLRGKLVSLDDRSVRIDLLGKVKELPRADVSRIIWLSVEGDATEAEAIAAIMNAPGRGGLPARATMTDGRRLSFVGERVAGDRVVGTSGPLGTVGVDLAACAELDLGRAASTPPPGKLPYAQWRLRPAAEPRALREPAAAVALPRDQPATGSPVAGPPASIPVLPFMEPDAAGRGHLSAVGLEGRIGVLGLVDVSDRAGLDRLPRLAEAVAALEPEGVCCAAVVAGGDRATVERALAGMQPRPSIALDPGMRLRAAAGEFTMPACLLVDREGCIADVLPLAEGGLERIRGRVEALVAGSRETRREFQALDRAADLARRGDRGCLDEFGGLLAAQSPAVRRRSIMHLRHLTGLWESEMPFVVDGQQAIHTEQLQNWRQWLAKEGLSAKLLFPQQREAEWAAGRPITGRTLVCRPARHDAVELDEAGKEVFTVAVQAGWACDVTPAGHRLIGDHAGKAVVEYDVGGKEVWGVRNLPGGPMSVRRLDNGNTLVALSDANVVAEYDPEGKMAWSVRVEGRPCDARRLPNGTTLVAAHRAGRLVELDVAGNEIWVAEGIEDPQSAQRLPSGNTLIAMSKPGVVREIDRAGRVVWQKQGFRIPVDAQRLPDGSTLVQEQQGDLVEFDALGSEVSRTSTGGSRFLRY
jgi:hypothetical protein